MRLITIQTPEGAPLADRLIPQSENTWGAVLEMYRKTISDSKHRKLCTTDPLGGGTFLVRFGRHLGPSAGFQLDPAVLVTVKDDVNTPGGVQ